MNLRNDFRATATAIFSSAGDRPAQEDHALIAREKGVFTVADGFGGPVPGAAAARTACEAVNKFLFREAGDDDATLPFVLRSYFSLAGNVLFNALIHANREVLKLNREKSVHERGGASVLAGFMDGNLLALANVGGCSAWLMRAGIERELATPRTYSRLCDPFEIEEHREWQVPLMALGLARDLEPEIFECKVQKGDWLFLHTDGIHPLVREKVLKLQARRQPAGLTADQLTHEVVAVLNGVQYQDNATAALVIF